MILKINYRHLGPMEGYFLAKKKYILCKFRHYNIICILVSVQNLMNVTFPK